MCLWGGRGVWKIMLGFDNISIWSLVLFLSKIWINFDPSWIWVNRKEIHPLPVIPTMPKTRTERRRDFPFPNSKVHISGEGCRLCTRWDWHYIFSCEGVRGVRGGGCLSAFLLHQTSIFIHRKLQTLFLKNYTIKVSTWDLFKVALADCPALSFVLVCWHCWHTQLNK